MLYRVFRHCIEVTIDEDKVFSEQNDQYKDQDKNKQGQIKDKCFGKKEEELFKQQNKDFWLISPIQEKNQIHRFNITKKQIKIEQSQIPFPQGYGLCMISNVCYVAGGQFSNSRITALCYKLDIARTSSLQKLNKSRYRLALSGLGQNTIFATGGRVQQSIVISQKYSINKNKWEFIEDLNEKRSAHSSCQFRNRYVFVFMGTNGKNDINSIEMYDDKESKTWKQVVIQGNQENLIATNCLGSCQMKNGVFLWSKFMNNYQSFFKFQFMKYKNNGKGGEEIEQEEDHGTPILKCIQILYKDKFCNSDSTCPIRLSKDNDSIYSMEYANKSIWNLKNDQWKELKEAQFEYLLEDN